MPSIKPQFRARLDAIIERSGLTEKQLAKRLAPALGVDVETLLDADTPIESNEAADRIARMDERDILTVTEVADALKISGALVRRYCATGRITAIESSSGYLITREALEEFQAKPRTPGRPAKSSVQG